VPNWAWQSVSSEQVEVVSQKHPERGPAVAPLSQ
jgi:hypothetical protein